MLNCFHGLLDSFSYFFTKTQIDLFFNLLLFGVQSFEKVWMQTGPFQPRDVVDVDRFRMKMLRALRCLRDAGRSAEDGGGDGGGGGGGGEASRAPD